MNISRIALLSALITVPMFSMENNDPKSNTVNTASTDTSTAEKAGIIAAITAFATARKDNSLAFLDFFANYSFNPFFRKLATFDCLKGGRFENNITPAGRVIISAAFVAIASMGL